MKQRLDPLGIKGHVDQRGDLSHLPDETATAVFRIAQEAIVNIVRHARAQAVWIGLDASADELTVNIEDNGMGLESHSVDEQAYRGMGILGMQERAAALDGQLVVTQRRPHGTRVTLHLPLLSDRE